MKHILYFVLIIAVLTLQIGISDLVAIREVRPDFLLIAVCHISMFQGRFRGILWGFGAGLLEDAFMSGLLGLGALSRSIAAFLAGSLMTNKSFHQSYEPSLIVTAIALVFNLLRYTIVALGEPHFLSGFWKYVIFAAIYTGVFNFIIYSLLPARIWEKVYKTDAAS